MAEYQILYWQHIPLSIKATDVNETVRQTLSGRFEEALRTASAGYQLAMHSTELRWSSLQERKGSASEVARTVAEELAKVWNAEEALVQFNNGELNPAS